MKVIIILILMFSFVVKVFSSEYWLPTSELPDAKVEALAYDHLNDRIFVAINGKGIYGTSDKGMSWIRIDKNDALMITKALVVTKNGFIFAGTNGYGVFRSIDGGNNWEEMNIGLTNKNVLTLYSHSDGTIYAGTWFYGYLFRSTNDGKSWEQLNVEGDIHAIIVDKNNHIFVGTRYLGVYRSTDKGATWQNIGLNSVDVFEFAINRYGELLAATNSGVMKFNDQTNNWNQIGTEIPKAAVLTIMSNDSYFLFAGMGLGLGVYRSTNDGYNWEPFLDGIEGKSIYAFIQDSSHILYAGTNSGVFKTRGSTSSIKIGEANECLNISLTDKNLIFENKCEKYFTIINLSIYNYLGVNIFKTEIQQMSNYLVIPLSELSLLNGIYFIELKTSTKLNILRLIVIDNKFYIEKY